jgi:octopine/nopaline transport system ATP-binding protein
MHRHPPTSPDAPAAVVIENLHKRFGSLEVLKGVSLTAREGGVVTLIGSSGSGKSTLLRCINFLETPDAGRIVIAGEEIALKRNRAGRAFPADPRQIDRIRTRLGMVFQSFNLWAHMTVLQNVIEAPVHVLKVPRGEATDRAYALLEKVGIADKAGAYPAELSGGQQQRAAIARALAMQPKVMLFDEPTSALDPELVGEVLLVIRQLAEEGNTMIMVTHEMGFAREVSSEVVFLHQGRVEESGPPEKVLGDPDSERVRQFLARHLSNND